MSRYLAASYHLLISLAVFAVLAWLVLFVWYPGFFYTIDGGWEGMRIIIAVDLVLGPLLTLIVFKAGKPGLKFDLAAIGMFQSICLAAGVYLVYNERPQFFVFYEKHFYSANADTYADYGQAVPDARKFADGAPAMVIAKVPSDPIEEADYRLSLYRQGIPIWVHEQSYEPLAPNIDVILTQGFDLEKLRERDSEGKLDAWLARHGGSAEDYAFYPVRSRYLNPFIAIDRKTKKFAGVLDIKAPLSSAG